jgi:hypothetical protein
MYPPDTCFLSSYDYGNILEDIPLCKVVLSTGQALSYLIRLLLCDYFVNVNIPLLEHEFPVAETVSVCDLFDAFS